MIDDLAGLEFATASELETVEPRASSGEPPTSSRPALLVYLPVSLFGSVMGLTGLSVAWRLAEVGYGAPGAVASSIGVLAALAFIAMTVGYGLKTATAWSAVRAEFRHPITGSLFGAALISLLLLPIILAPVSLRAAQVMWAFGAVGMLAFAWTIVTRWLREQQQIAHATPAWIIPVVGLLDVPLAARSLALPDLHGVMLLCLAVGLFFAVPLFTIIFSRLLFEPKMPAALSPTLMILLAPFSVGFSTYVTTTDQVDLFAESLFALALFLLAVLVAQLRHLPKCCPFKASWWAVSFPLAATAVAGLKFAAAKPSLGADAIAWILLSFATIVIAGLAAQTVTALWRGELRTISS